MIDFNLDTLKAFIRKQGFGHTLPFPFLIKQKEIDRNSTLGKDLGITGDDADEFLVAFAKEFKVDVGQFPIGDYFNDEGDVILPSIIRIITGKRKRERKILTVGHLEKAMIAGRLDEEVINS